MNKIGRNQLCPCGSGKKYKHCCLNKDINFEPRGYGSKVEEYIVKHDKSDILNLIVSLQLSPNNHGANVRIEKLANLVVSHLHTGNHLPQTNLKYFQGLLDVEYAYDNNEDSPINLFTELFAYYGGNYQVFGGIGTHSVELLTNLTNVIGSFNDWPLGFKDTIEKGCLCLLNIIQQIAEKANLNGYIIGNNGHKKFDYTYFKDYSLTRNDIAQILFRLGIPEYIYNTFVWNEHRGQVNYDDINSSTLLCYPIIEYNERVYVLLLSNEADCINKYILREAEECGCESLLIKRVHQSQMDEILESCSHMEWRKITEIRINDDANMYDFICQMDTNWYVHVCYVHDSSEEWKKSNIEKNITNYLKTEASWVHKTIGRSDDYGMLQLILYGNMGESMCILNHVVNTDLLQMFSVQDFLHLCYVEKWNNLSILHFAQAQQGVNFMSSDSVDIYAIYKSHSNSFYLSDVTKPDLIQPEVNIGYANIIESKIRRNKHAALINWKGTYAHILVERVMDEGPIFGAHPSIGFFAQCLECFKFPLWVVCEQSNVYYYVFNKFANMFTFWLYCLSSGIIEDINAKYSLPIIIKLNISQDCINIGSTLPNVTEDYTIIKNENEIDVCVNAKMLKSVLAKTNAGEREVMKRLVCVLLNDWSENQVQMLIDKYIPEGMAKMMLVIDTSVNILMDPRWLPHKLYIPAFNTSQMLDMMSEIMTHYGYSETKKIVNRKEKSSFLRIAVQGYLSKLKDYCDQFENNELIVHLMNRYERLIYEREHNKLILPAQELCFGLTEKQKEEISVEEQKLTSSGLALRCLIEYVAAQPTSGIKQCGDYEIGIMMAYMHEIDVLGSICASIDLGMSNHVIEKLPSGRYGIYDDMFSENIQAFQDSYMTEMELSQLQHFASMLRLSDDIKTTNENEEYQKKFDTAFLNDWGFTLTSAVEFAHVCSILCCEQKTSVLVMPKHDFFNEIQKIIPKLHTVDIEKMIRKFSLNKREKYLPDLDLREYAPWEYNREYSYIRRFIICVDDTLFFGMRNATCAAFQLLQLLFDGRLNCCDVALKALKGNICKEKGDGYTRMLRMLLKKISSWEVINYEVKIDRQAPFNADNDYGDIDVMVYDRENAIVYSLECKDTARARNIHEMKTEMDRFLGFAKGGEQPTKHEQERSWMGKHLKRHNWLCENKEKVMKFLKDSKEPEIRSIFVTSSILPLSYLKDKELSLPIISYCDIETQGICALTEAWRTFKNYQKDKL